jgi:putative transcriptional regulator
MDRTFHTQPEDIKKYRRLFRRLSGGIAVVSVLFTAFLMVLITLPAGRAAGPVVPPQMYGHVNYISGDALSPAEFLISQAALSKGTFLVAGRDLIDPNFSETVVLLTSYDWNGAMGLVINRPADVRLSKVLPDIKGIRRRKDKIYIGGPVERNQLFMLIRSDKLYEDTVHVSDDIYVSMSRDVLQKLVKDAETEERFRVYAGYAGWTSGQLESEVERGDWLVIHADAESIFDKDADAIWRELIEKSSAQWVKLDYL